MSELVQYSRKNWKLTIFLLSMLAFVLGVPFVDFNQLSQASNPQIEMWQWRAIQDPVVDSERDEEEFFRYDPEGNGGMWISVTFNLHIKSRGKQEYYNVITESVEDTDVLDFGSEESITKEYFVSQRHFGSTKSELIKWEAKLNTPSGEVVTSGSQVVHVTIRKEGVDNPRVRGGGGGGGGGGPIVCNFDNEDDGDGGGGGGIRDSDCDELTDSEEAELGTNPFDSDSDNDGLGDGYEVLYGLNPNIADDTSTDEDNDGLTLLKEFEYGSNPYFADADKNGDHDESDGVPDFWEIQTGTDPAYADARELPYVKRTGESTYLAYENRALMSDFDSDGLLDHQEELWGTDPNITNTDGDAFSDLMEVYLDTNRHGDNDDIDQDGVSNQVELIANTSPIDSDTDWDGLPDGWESARPEYNARTLMDGLQMWLRMDRAYFYYQGDGKMRFMNSAFINQGGFTSDVDGRGRIGMRWDEDLGHRTFFIDGRTKGFLTIPDSSSLLDADETTIAVRLKVSDLKCSHQNQRLVYQDGKLDIIRLSTGEISVALTQEDGTVINHIIENAPVMDQWWHLAFSISKQASTQNDIFKLFVNAEERLSVDVQGGFGSTPWPFHIGSPNSEPILTPNARFSDFRIYSKILSALDLEILSDLNHADRDENKDIDGDTVPNGIEFQFGSDPEIVDTDGDGLTDAEEIFGDVTSYPYLVDSDGDGLSDFQEVTTFNTNPLYADTDYDGLLDSEELELFYPNDTGGQGNPSPLVYDTDGDGMSDGQEIRYQTNPLIPNSPDMDGDGVDNLTEIWNRTDPRFAPGQNYLTDTDGDGLSDLDEISVYGTNPLLEDTFGDGLTDFQRVTSGLIGVKGDIHNAQNIGATDDHDGDGVMNIDEVTAGTDPMMKSNMGATIVNYKPLTEIPTITKSEAEEHGSEYEYGKHSVSLYIPDNARVSIIDPDKSPKGWIIINTLEIGGFNVEGDTVEDRYSGYISNDQPGWQYAGSSPREAYTGNGSLDISGFVSQLKRDGDSMVQLNIRNLATHEIEKSFIEEDLDNNDYNYSGVLSGTGWNGGYGGGFGGGGSGSGSGSSSWQPNVDIFNDILKELLDTLEEKEPNEPFLVSGSTKLRVAITAVDLDVRSAGQSGPFMSEDKERQKAAVVSPTDLNYPTEPEPAMLLLHPTGVEGAERRLKWSAGLYVYRGVTQLDQGVDGYIVPESDGKLELSVYTDVNSPSGGSVTMSAFSDGTAVGPSDSVTLTDIPVSVFTFPDEAVFVPADEQIGNIYFSVDVLAFDPVDYDYGMVSVDTATLGIRVKHGDADWVDMGTITATDGVAIYELNTTTIDRDTYWVKAYVKDVTWKVPNDAGGMTSHSANYGDAAKELGEDPTGLRDADGVEIPASSNSGLLGFSYRIEVIPGLPTTVEFVSDPEQYPADGISKMEISAIPKDAFGNKMRPNTPVAWEMKGNGSVDTETYEIDDNGVAKILLESKNKRSEDFYQSVALQTGRAAPFDYSVGNLQMMVSLEKDGESVVIGGKESVIIEASFSTVDGTPLPEDLEVKWFSSNGTFYQEGVVLDENGKARIWVTGNGAVIGKGHVFVQAGTASAMTSLDWVAKEGTVGLQVMTPTITYSGTAGGRTSDRTDVVVTGPAHAVVSVGFDEVAALSGVGQLTDVAAPLASEYFTIVGLNQAGQVTLDADGTAMLSVVATKALPSTDLAVNLALVGRAEWTNPQTDEIIRYEVTPSRVITMQEKALGVLLDYAEGFVVGESENLTQVSGEITAGFIPIVGFLADGRDVLREVGRFLIPGGKDGDALTFGVALVGVVLELTVFFDVAYDAFQATLKLAKTVINAIDSIKVSLKLYGSGALDLFMHLNRASSIIARLMSDFRFDRLQQYLDDTGIVHLVEYLQKTNNSVGFNSIIDQHGNLCYLVTSTSGLNNALDGLKSVSKTRRGLEQFGRILGKFENNGQYIADALTQVSRNLPKRAGKRILSTLDGNSFPPEIIKMLDEIGPDDVADIAKFFENLGKVFTKTRVNPSDMRKILKNDSVFTLSAKTDAAGNADVMTLGMLLDNMRYVASKLGNESDGVIKGLTKYPSRYLGSDFVGFITHGRRFELDRIAKKLKTGDYKSGQDVRFHFMGRTRVSDIDGIDGVVAESIKRQGKTVDRWVKDKSDDWLKLWMIGASKASGGKEIRFITGKNAPSAPTQQRLNKIKPEGHTIFFEIDELLPPPSL